MADAKDVADQIAEAAKKGAEGIKGSGGAKDVADQVADAAKKGAEGAKASTGSSGKGSSTVTKGSTDSNYIVNATAIENNIIEPLKKCSKYLKIAKEEGITFTYDIDTYNRQFTQRMNSVKKMIEEIKKDVDSEVKIYENIIQKARAADSRSRGDVPSGKDPYVPFKPQGTDSGSQNVKNPDKDPYVRLEENETPTENPKDAEISTEDQDVGLEGNETPTDTPTDVEIPDEDQDIGLEEIVPDTQVEAVIDLIYDENPNLTDEEKERIVEAIANINETEILEGLDEDVANRIRAEIVDDYLDGELELDSITTEQLQEYIESHPDIQIGFEINEAISNFESLIEAGVVTEEEIKAIIENNIVIHDENAFIEEYIEAGGTETDVSDIESFYDPETQTVHVRDTSDSVVITNSIITILGLDITMDGEITGDSVAEDVQIGEIDTTIEMPEETIDGSENMTDVELDEDTTTIQKPNDIFDETGSMADAEIDGNEAFVNPPNGKTDK